jgi:hypothetical protein
MPKAKTKKSEHTFTATFNSRRGLTPKKLKTGVAVRKNGTVVISKDIVESASKLNFESVIKFTLSPSEEDPLVAGLKFYSDKDVQDSKAVKSLGYGVQIDIASFFKYHSVDLESVEGVDVENSIQGGFLVLDLRVENIQFIKG